MASGESLYGNVSDAVNDFRAVARGKYVFCGCAHVVVNHYSARRSDFYTCGTGKLIVRFFRSGDDNYVAFYFSLGSDHSVNLSVRALELEDFRSKMKLRSQFFERFFNGLHDVRIRDLGHEPRPFFNQVGFEPSVCKVSGHLYPERSRGDYHYLL